MQVNKVNSVIPTKINKKGNINNNNTKHNTSFKGIGNVLDSFALGVANAIENGGLAVSFTLQDMLGTNLPRPLMGLRRNSKENNGEFNFSFAAKEITREFLTGPSMFIIPGVMLALGKKFIGETINVPMKFIKSFGNIHAKQIADEAGNAISPQDFYRNGFAEMIKNAKGEKEVSKETLLQAKDFAQRLVDGIKDQPQGIIFKKIFPPKGTLDSLNDDFVKIAKQNAKSPFTELTSAAVSDTTAGAFKTTVKHMVSYGNDVILKAAEKSKEIDLSQLSNYVKNMVNKKTIIRGANNFLMYAAILTFLQVIPKLYNKAEGKNNAGLKGLMNEETLHDASLNEPDNNKKDKSKPSFGGSVTQLAEGLVGNSKLAKFAQAFEFNGPNVSFPLLLGIMGGGILIPRTLRAKDKYDREEILRRDLVTCAVMCFGEKALRKGFSKYNESKTGLVLARKPANLKNMSPLGKLFNFIRPIKGVQVLSSDQINSIYTDINEYNGGIKGFCNLVSANGGNLGKMFGINERSKEIVNGLLEQEGSSIAKADNSLITSVLDKAKDSEAVKELASLFHKAKVEEVVKRNGKVVKKIIENDWVKKAKTMNARFTALSVCLIVPVFLGFMLPAINEKFTKKRIKQEKELAALNKNNIQLMNAEYFEKNNKAKNIFADMKL